jgi:hypothetical protein
MTKTATFVFLPILAAATLIPTVAFANDINGDGRADWVTINPAGGTINVGLSNGIGFNLWTWARGPVVGGSNKNYFADVNGDGRTDWVTINPAGGAINVGLSNGTGFNLWTWIRGPVVGEFNENYFADVNGDGRADWITINPAGGAINVGLTTPAS